MQPESCLVHEHMEPLKAFNAQLLFTLTQSVTNHLSVTSILNWKFDILACQKFAYKILDCENFMQFMFYLMNFCPKAWWLLT